MVGNQQDSSYTGDIGPSFFEPLSERRNLMAEYTFHPSVSPHADTNVPRASAAGRGSVEQALCDNEGLIHAVIQREGSGSLSYEEALQAGRSGLWRALLGYDPKRGTAFSTYAWVAIRRHIRHAATEIG